MKKVALLTSALVLAAVAVAGAGVHVVGGTPGSNNTIPFRGGGTVPAYRWQTLWFQSEIDEAGPITKIEWYTWAPTQGGTFNNCDILLCHTNVSAVAVPGARVTRRHMAKIVLTAASYHQVDS